MYISFVSRINTFCVGNVSFVEVKINPTNIHICT